MTANSEFQANLQAGRVNESIARVVSQLVHLDIVTLLPATEGSVGQKALSTKVDLLAGKITNEISPEFLQDESYAKFLNFHTAQIDATSQMVREQIHGLHTLLGNGHEIPTMPAVQKPEVVMIETPKASTDTMPVQAPTVELRPANPEPPAIVSHLPAETTKVPPEVALVENLGLTDAADKPAAETPQAPQTPPTDAAVPMVAKVAGLSPPPATEPEPPLSAVVTTNPATSIATASAISAVIAQAGSPDLSEASAIPNKLDQAMRSAGVKPEVEDRQHPFDLETIPSQVAADSSSTVPAPVDAAHPTANLDRELIDLLNDPNEQWDEWLLEDELSQVSQDATKAKIPDLEADWFAQPVARGEDSGMDDWEKFIPEYTEPNSTTNKGQANVERFRQNLVNDPQLMNELLAELDDIEQLGEDKTPGNQPKS